MVTPMVDVDVGTIYEIAVKFEEAILKTMKEIEWKAPTKDVITIGAAAPTVEPLLVSKCNANFHATESCTTCTAFVCQSVRSRFLQV